MAGALAVAATKDPLRIVLQRSDMPATAKYTTGRLPAMDKGLRAAGIIGETAFHYSDIRRSATRSDQVSGFVVVLESASQARRAYRLFKDDLEPKPGSVVRLPAYGDEQFAFWTESVSKAQLLVRKGSIVWQLEVNPDPGTKAQTIAQLKGYAVKQKRRIA